MVDDRIQKLKKFLHDYAAAATATILLVVVLIALILARQISLASITDLSKINPLITSGQNELIAAADASGVIEVSQDEKEKDKDGDGKDDKTNAPLKSNNGKTTGGTSTGGSGGGSGSGGGTGGGEQPGGGGNPDLPPPFSAEIGLMSHFGSSPSGLLGTCTITHDIEVDVHGQNAPGTVSYRWKRSNGNPTTPQNLNFQAGDTTKVAAHEWVITAASGNYSIRFDLLTPEADADDQTLEFRHSCPVIGL